MSQTGGSEVILVADDDLGARLTLVNALERHGYAVVQAGDGEEALELFSQGRPDLVILDIGMPKADGFAVLQRIRQVSDNPVIFLTARDDEVDRVVGLELGADDYVTKPYSLRELVARIRARLRVHALIADRPADGRRGLIQLGNGATLDPRAREVVVAGALVPFTSREFDVLCWLVSHSREAFSRSQLLDAIWGTRYKDPATVTEHVRRIRAKLEAFGVPGTLTTLRGAGYRYDP